MQKWLNWNYNGNHLIKLRKTMAYSLNKAKKIANNFKFHSIKNKNKNKR